MKVRPKSIWMRGWRWIQGFRSKRCRQRSRALGDRSRWKSPTWPRLRRSRNLRRRNLSTDRRARDRPRLEKFAARSGGEDRPARRPFSGGSRSAAGGFSRPAGAYVPRGGRIAASADGRPEADRPRPSGPGRIGPGRFSPGRSGPGGGAGRSGPPRYGSDRDAGPSRGGFSRDRGERGAKTQEKKGYAAKGHGMGERARRWEKAGEVPEAPASGRKPFAPKAGGFKPGGAKFGGGKSFGAKRAGSKFGSPKPWQSRSSAAKAAEIVRNRGRNLMVREIREANHGPMREAELASRMRRNPPDSNRGARSRGRQNPAMASLRHDHALLGKQEIGLSRGSATVPKRETGRRGKNRMASLLDLSRPDLRARDSSRRAHDLLKRDRLTANRDLRERSPGRRKVRVRGLAAQNLIRRVPLASRSPRLAAQSRGRSDPLPRMAKDLRPNAAIEKKPLERGRERRAAPSHSGLKIRGAGKVRRQRAAAIVRKESMRRERAARRNDRDLPGNGGIGAATAAPGDCHRWTGGRRQKHFGCTPGAAVRISQS